MSTEDEMIDQAAKRLAMETIYSFEQIRDVIRFFYAVKGIRPTLAIEITEAAIRSATALGPQSLGYVVMAMDESLQ